MTFYTLVLKIREHNIKRVKNIKRKEKVRRVKEIKGKKCY